MSRPERPTMHDAPNLPSDRQLADAACAGSDAAWQELVARHEASIRGTVGQRGLVLRHTVSVALDELHAELAERPGDGEPAIRAFRPRAIAAVTDGDFGPGDVASMAGSDDDRRIGPTIDLSDDDARLLAAAFARLPETWQTVLWHIHVERQTAAEVSPHVGRRIIDVTELLSTAERGLIEAYLYEYRRSADPDDASFDIVALLAGYVRGALPPHEKRLVEAHLQDEHARDRGANGARPHGADDSRRLIGVAQSLPDALPTAIAPGITGMSVERHRAALGTATRAFGSAAMNADRSDRVRRAIVIGSAVAVLLALIGVAFLVRQPFDNDDGGSSPSTSSDASHPGPVVDIGAYALAGDS